MTANIGHNNPPSPLETLKEKLALYKEGAGAFGPVTDANAQEYRDHIGYGGKLAKEIDAQRDSEKRPHLEAGRKIDAAYKPLIEDTETVQKKLKKTLEAFVVAREREARQAAEEAARKLREAEEAKRVAETASPEEDPFLAATAASVPDIAVIESDAKFAASQASAASRVSSAAGGFSAAGLRTVRKAKVTDWDALIQHYAGHREVRELCEKLANADIRHAKGNTVTIGGVEVVEDRVL